MLTLGVWRSKDNFWGVGLSFHLVVKLDSWWALLPLHPLTSHRELSWGCSCLQLGLHRSNLVVRLGCRAQALLPAEPSPSPTLWFCSVLFCFSEEGTSLSQAGLEFSPILSAEVTAFRAHPQHCVLWSFQLCFCPCPCSAGTEPGTKLSPWRPVLNG